jgi:hypothetical protein
LPLNPHNILRQISYKPGISECNKKLPSTDVTEART